MTSYPVSVPPRGAETRALLARSRSLCRLPRRICGASDLDSPFVAELIARTPMCEDCLAHRIGIPIAVVKESLARLRRAVTLTDETSRCESCLRTVTVYRISDGTGNGRMPAALARARPLLAIQSEAIWRFLESRRGEMFCTQCISGALRATKRIDRALLSAEARGARRRYGPCAACGRERLLCGLTR